MKKELLSLIALAGIVSVNAQTQTEAVQLQGDGWASNVIASSGTIDFTSQYAECYIGLDGVISLADYKGFEVEVEEAVEGVQFKVYAQDGEDWKEGGYPQLLGTTSTYSFEDMAYLSGTTKTKVTFQSNKENVSIKVKAVRLIKTDGTKENVGFAKNWGCNVAGCYSGLATFTKQYGSIGSVSNISLAEYSGYKVVLNEAAPEGIECKITVKFVKSDGGDGYSYVDSKTDYIDGKTEAYIDFANCGLEEGVETLESVSLQTSAIGCYPYTIDVKSVELIKVDASDATDIDSVNANAEIVSVTYTTLSGVISVEPIKGVNVKTVVYSDGSKKVSKIVVR